MELELFSHYAPPFSMGLPILWALKQAIAVSSEKLTVTLPVVPLGLVILLPVPQTWSSCPRSSQPRCITQQPFWRLSPPQVLPPSRLGPSDPSLPPSQDGGSSPLSFPAFKDTPALAQLLWALHISSVSLNLDNTRQFLVSGNNFWSRERAS